MDTTQFLRNTTQFLRTRQPSEEWAEFCVRIGKSVGWLLEANLRGADLRGADLEGADLGGANLRHTDLRHTDLRGVAGNGREVKSIRLYEWTVVWFYSGNELTLAVGCQQHPLSVWLEATDEWLLGLDSKALEWRDRYGDAILSLVRSSSPEEDTP